MIDLTENTATGGYDGLFTVGIDAPTGLRDNSGQPEGFQLNQNYPNPFNPSTTIAYTLPEATAVDLRVYDALGQEVAVLVNGRQTTGDHRVRFDALNLESGFYFYRIKAGAFAQVKEMVLIK
ncbi:MAG TPA: T9SS type A sorting domain-containing protein [Calditrichia bacterium]|nr:T9SS type A sorting domain-containing protein [Calditrichia bacterium]